MKFDSSSEFFDSEMVQASLEEIKELQDLITNSIIDTAFSSVTGYEEDELEQLDLIEELLEKQKLMYFRCKISNDEDALLVAENMRDSLRQMGMPRGATVEQMFDKLKGSIRKLRETLDN
jgi:anion-transporting  ArsA/GET3 family ATPase